MSPTAGIESRRVMATLGDLLRDFPGDWAELGPRELWDLAMSAKRVVSQADAVATMLLAAADAAQPSGSAGTGELVTRMSRRLNVSKKQASAMMWDARRLGQLEHTTQAVLDGRITMSHAKAVSKAMEQMPHGFNQTQTRQAEDLLLDLAGRATPDDVARAVNRVVETVDPTDPGETQAALLTRQREVAVQNRSLTFTTRQGSVLFTGSLPLVEGEQFHTVITAYTAQARRNQIEAGDPSADTLTPQQRQADALTQLVWQAQAHADAPLLAGDRPTIMVTLDYDKLHTKAVGAGVLPDGQTLCAGDLRRLCCDANLIPAVLNTTSQPLDVGATNRFVTNPIRKALTLRDQCCAFPNCHTPAALCDAHHIQPWWAGGPTALNNLVLLCPTHHGMIEPDKHTTRDQWKVTIHEDGHPIFTPPGHQPDPGPLRGPGAPPLISPHAPPLINHDTGPPG